MWKEEPAEIKLQYQREADLALVEHKKKYPFYKYKPKKKDGKNKSKSQQVNNKTSKNKRSSSIKSSNDNKDNKKDINNEEDDSQVPIEHRKQAAMESAFTVFDLDTPISKDNSNNNNSNSSPHSPTNNITMSNPQVMTPIWTDYDKQFFDSPINERLNYSPLQLPSPQPQSQPHQQHQPLPPCQCTTHCVNNHNNNNNGVASIASVTTALETLSSEQWNAVSEIFSNVLECMGVIPHSNNPTTPIEATPTSIAPISGMSEIAPSGMAQTSIAGMDITTPTTTLDNMIMSTFNTDYFQITAHDWNDMEIDDMGDIGTNYVVPSQSTSEPVPPPTPTSPTDYLSWATSTHQSIDSQFTVADPITNITNVITATEQFSQINQTATNDNLFTSADNDNICTLFNSDFDNDFNFTL